VKPGFDPPVVFVGGPIQHAVTGNGFDVRVRRLVAAVIETLSTSGLRVLSAHVEEDYGAATCWFQPDGIAIRDFEWMTHCAAFVALLPSDGHGDTMRTDGTHIELGWASALGRPVVLLLESSTPMDRYTHLVRGLPRLTSVEVVRYEDLASACNGVLQALGRLGVLKPDCDPEHVKPSHVSAARQPTSTDCLCRPPVDRSNPDRSGWDFDVWFLERDRVLRAPKSRDARFRLVREIDLLGCIGHSIDLLVPQYGSVTEPSDQWPHGFALGRRLRGRPLDLLSERGRRNAVPVLGDVLRQLGSIETSSLPPSVCRGSKSTLSLELERAHGMLRAEGHEVALEVRDRAARLLERLSQVPVAPPSRARLNHNDLAPYHVLVPRCGGAHPVVLDWADASVGELALDLLWPWIYGGTEFVRRSLEYSQMLESDEVRITVDRVVPLAAAKAVRELVYGSRDGDAAKLHAATTAILRETPR
jgi:aminoglycoside phosphotransferase (APT) family kinase protein